MKADRAPASVIGSTPMRRVAEMWSEIKTETRQLPQRLLRGCHRNVATEFHLCPGNEIRKYLNSPFATVAMPSHLSAEAEMASTASGVQKARPGWVRMLAGSNENRCRAEEPPSNTKIEPAQGVSLNRQAPHSGRSSCARRPGSTRSRTAPKSLGRAPDFAPTPQDPKGCAGLSCHRLIPRWKAAPLGPAKNCSQDRLFVRKFVYC